MIPDLEKLRTFFALAQTGSYTEAASRLFRTQSAVSHSIRKLEESLGVELVSRSGRKTVLTEEGRRLYRTCEKIFHSLDATLEELANHKNRPLGLLRLGVTVEFGSAILMKHLKPFLEEHREIEFEFTMSHSLLTPLIKDELDIIIDCAEHHVPGLVKTPLFREAYSIVCSPVYKREHGIEEIKDLERATLISFDRQGTWWNRFMKSAGGKDAVEINDFMQVNHIRAMIVAAEHGIGVILVPRYSILRELEAGALVALFPKIELLEDWFRIYQKKTKAKLKRHQLLTEYLQTIKPEELGAS